MTRLRLLRPEGSSQHTSHERFAAHVSAAEYLSRTAWSFREAIRFWRLRWQDYGEGIDRQLDAFGVKLLGLEAFGKMDTNLANKVRELHEMLLEKYDQHLEVLRQRKG